MHFSALLLFPEPEAKRFGGKGENGICIRADNDGDNALAVDNTSLLRLEP